MNLQGITSKFRSHFQKEIPVWDGDPDNLPEKGKWFVYKDEKYAWRDCPCKCGRPKAYDASRKWHLGLTRRLRGANQGDPRLSVLYKLGLVEEMVAAEYDFEKIGHLLNEEVGKATESEVGIDAYLAERGISIGEMMAATALVLFGEEAARILAISGY